MKDLCELLANNSYPGRGIVVGNLLQEDITSFSRASLGKQKNTVPTSWNCIYYFIMGRSANSRNRVFEETHDGIRTCAFNPELVEDPSLIMYHPVRNSSEGMVIANGNQSDTICEKGWMRACMEREYEPDAPHFTPRISALVRNNGTCSISLLKRQGTSCQRNFYNYESVEEQTGYFISTYVSDGNLLPSFVGEPICVRMRPPSEVWQALNTENKISLYACINGKVRLWNKNCGD